MTDSPAAAVAGGLEAWLGERGEPQAVSVRGRATVGLSQETWFVTLSDSRGAQEAVLRLPTPASGARAIRSQAAALQAVAGVIPAPRLLWQDEGERNPFARPFLVMERMPGTVPVQWRDCRGSLRIRLAEAAMDVLADLHAMPVPAAPELPSQMHMPATALSFYARRLERMSSRPAVLELALWWLMRHLPEPPERPCLVHGDFRMGNLMVDGARISGVLDWEMAGIGDSAADLMWCFIPIWRTPEIDEAQMIARYERAIGASCDRERLRWHRVFGYLRLAYYAISGMEAFLSGRSSDLRLAALRLQLPVHLDRLAATLAQEEVS